MVWVAGRKSCVSERKFPIQKIWFNDKPNVLDYVEVNAPSSTAKGWMSEVLKLFEGIPNLPTPNDEFERVHPQNIAKKTLVVSKPFDVVIDERRGSTASISSSKSNTKASSPSRSSKSKASSVGLSGATSYPAVTHVNILGPRPLDLYNVRKHADGSRSTFKGVLVKRSNKAIDSLKSKLGRTDYAKAAPDEDPKNQSSIMFGFVNDGGMSEDDINSGSSGPNEMTDIPTSSSNISSDPKKQRKSKATASPKTSSSSSSGRASQNSDTSVPSSAVRKNQDTILFTGDSTGEILDTNYRDADLHFWDIMKVMHHGSSRNNVLVHTGGSVSDNIRQASVRFFRKYVATKYCISGDTTGKLPNPDILMLLGLVRARQHVMEEQEFYIYITNGLTVKQYEKIESMQHRKNVPRIFVLKNEEYRLFDQSSIQL